MKWLTLTIVFTLVATLIGGVVSPAAAQGADDFDRPVLDELRKAVNVFPLSRFQKEATKCASLIELHRQRRNEVMRLGKQGYTKESIKAWIKLKEDMQNNPQYKLCGVVEFVTGFRALDQSENGRAVLTALFAERGSGQTKPERAPQVKEFYLSPEQIKDALSLIRGYELMIGVTGLAGALLTLQTDNPNRVNVAIKVGAATASVLAFKRQVVQFIIETLMSSGSSGSSPEKKDVNTNR